MQKLSAYFMAIRPTIVALTALVMGITSLVKTCDKRLEQASYETLAASIKDVQESQMALREEVAALRADRDGDGITDAADGPLSCEADAGALAVKEAGADSQAPLGVATGAPKPPKPTGRRKISAKEPLDGGLDMIKVFTVSDTQFATPGPKEPLKWAQVKELADKM